MKNRLSYHLFSGILLLMLVFSITGCKNRTQTIACKTIPGTRAQHGSRFEAFVSRLKSLPESGRDTSVLNLIKTLPTTPVYEKDSIVSLYWYGKAKHVCINGDLQFGWSVPDTMDAVPCGETTFFHRTYTLPFNTRLDYQLIIDTTATTDPRNLHITPSGFGPHSEIAMPGFYPDPFRQFRPDIHHGTIGSLLFTSHDTAIKSRQVKIYIPAGYSDLSHLPVLYVLDGIEAMDFMSYPVVLDNLIADRKIKPVIAVFIPPADRYSEFMGNDHKAFMNAICNELVPVIEREYKTAREPKNRAITGISAGAYFALLTVFSRPDVFQCGACQSTTLTDEFYDVFHSYSGKGKNRPLLHIYLDVGRFDLTSGTVNNLTFLQANENLDRDMNQSEINHAFHVFNDGHSWANWRERTDDILVYLFGSEKP
ncbi:MAG: alpha/beta hydrolase-fold protein [Bacteroidetes bacterium]|nr:alpha/beta hydrolase-fold protein [Bacteroidota bacterium]